MSNPETASLTAKSPWGPVGLRARDSRLVRVELGGDAGTGDADAPVLHKAAAALDAYFKSGTLNPVGLCFHGISEFDRAAYEALLTVPAGEVVTYGELAERAGRPGAARAVGGAMGRNPLPLFVPCHRVIRTDRGLGGFGAGLHWKRRLLEHEGWKIESEEVMRP